MAVVDPGDTFVQSARCVVLFSKARGQRHERAPRAAAGPIRVSQRMMSGVPGEDVPLEVVQRLWSQESGALNDVRQVAGLIHRLCQASVTDSAVSTGEKRTIRRDAARRLSALARSRIRDVRLWEVLGLACRLDPLFGSREVTGLLWRAVRGRFLS